MTGKAKAAEVPTQVRSSFLALLVALAMVFVLTAILFTFIGVGWSTLQQFPNLLLDSPHFGARAGAETRTVSRELSRESKEEKKERNLRATAGSVAGPNVKLVCSDESFAAAVAKVRPAVVSLSCESIQGAPAPSTSPVLDDPAPDLPATGGIGSGMVVDGRGYILTCYHIVARTQNIIVTPFGTTAQAYPAHVVGKDENLNLALLRVHVPYELPAVNLGDSSTAEVADVVLAIGNPFGLEQTVTHGIVSDNSRDLILQDRVLHGMLQTDAAINRGSSGGPLVNISGEVIGINMAIYSPTGFYNGVSFAMPINQAKEFLIRAIPRG